MRKIEDGGPVYPFIHTGMKGDGMHTEQRSGMTLRDHFASQALVGILSSGLFLDPEGLWVGNGAAPTSEAAYLLADAMIAARKGGEA